MELLEDPLLWTSVVVVYRECLSKRSGEQLPHVAQRIDSFLDRARSWTLSDVYECTSSLHCMRLLEDRRPAVESLYREWEFNAVVAQAAKSGDLSSLAWLADSYMLDGTLSSAAQAAAASGQVPVLKWLLEKHKARVHWGGLEWYEAIREGQTHVIEWLQQHATPNEDAVWRLVLDAATRGDLELVQWLLAHNGAAINECAPSAMRDAVLGHHVPVILFLLKNYQHDICEEGICFLRDEWEDLEVRFVGLTQWLLEQFGGALEGASFSVNRADWATNKWMIDRNVQHLDVEDGFVYWECGPVYL
ncbi:hypothetical protein PC120_g7900 [Phytophthora cactorum]|nr:hypothetical protein PC120_g7900 [Phytophthora cactorum]